MAKTDDGNSAARAAGDGLPSWLSHSENYEPVRDRDRFVSRTLLQLSAILAQLRFDDGRRSSFSPNALIKLGITVGAILLCSMARNFLFVLVLLAIVLVRACVLPQRHLARLAAVACSAAGLTCLIMIPAVLMGQPRSLVTLSVKALVSCSLTMELALTTPLGELTGALRSCRIPNIAILSFELALRSIVDLGTVATETLEALRMRSVGRNPEKAKAMGGVGGVLFVKAAESSHQTFDAMRCRGFTGTYDASTHQVWSWTDAVWLCAFVGLVALFFRLEGIW